MKVIRKRVFVITLIAAISTLALAQDDAKPARPLASRSAAQAKMPPQPQASPEMTKLIKMLAGNWTVTEKSEPSPMFPNGGSGKGTARMWAGPGGLSLLETYHSSGMMGSNFNGFGTFWWDPKEQVYHGLWCDSMTPNGCDASGTTKWDGETLVGMMEGEMNGKKTVSKFTYANWKPDSFVMTMATGPDANSLKDLVAITYTRSAAAGKPSQ
jgi:hypothetical protein